MSGSSVKFVSADLHWCTKMEKNVQKWSAIARIHACASNHRADCRFRAAARNPCVPPRNCVIGDRAGGAAAQIKRLVQTPWIDPRATPYTRCMAQLSVTVVAISGLGGLIFVGGLSSSSFRDSGFRAATGNCSSNDASMLASGALLGSTGRRAH